MKLSFNLAEIMSAATLKRREKLPRTTDYSAEEKAAMQERPLSLAQLRALQGFDQPFDDDLSQWDATVKLEELADDRRECPDAYPATPGQISALVDKFGCEPAQLDGISFGQATELMDAFIARIRGREAAIVKSTRAAPKPAAKKSAPSR